MKTRKKQDPTASLTVKTNTSSNLPPKPEEIRQRAHEIFLARGGEPGQELEDWLRAEQELKQH